MPKINGIAAKSRPHEISSWLCPLPQVSCIYGPLYTTSVAGVFVRLEEHALVQDLFLLKCDINTQLYCSVLY